MHKTFFYIFFIVLCIFCLNNLFCSDLSSVDSKLQKQLSIVFTTPPSSLHPHNATFVQETQILSSTYEGLFSYSPVDLTAQNALIQDYKVSRNKLTWTFYIKPTAKFSDGTEITSEDIKKSWLDLLNPQQMNPFASFLDCIEGVQEYRENKLDISKVAILTPEKNKLVLRLKSPTSHLPQILCHHAFSVIKENTFSGAYIIKEHNKNFTLLEKNPHYWDNKNVAIPSIMIKYNSNTEQNTFEFNCGKVQWIDGSVEIDKILDKNSITIDKQFCTEFLFFKVNEEPFNNKDFRTALLSAIPWDDLRNNHFISAESFITPLPYYPEIPGIGDYDLDYAKSLLEKSGYLSQKTKIIFAIPDDNYYFELSNLLKNAWEKIGVELVIQKTPLNRYYDSIPSWNAHLFYYTWVGDFIDPMTFLELFRDNSSLNNSGWKDPKYEKYLQDASITTDSTFRYKLLSEAEQYLLDSSIVIPISHPLSLNIVDFSVLKGWHNNPLDIHLFKYLYFIPASQNLLIVQN